MLAVATTEQLLLVDPQTLKRPPSSLPSCLSLLTPCIASTWSPDNTYLYLASANAIHQYNPTLNTLTDIYTSDGVITHLVCKTTSSLVFATATSIHILEAGSITRTIVCDNAPTSLTLSNDLIAWTSSETAHVYNLLSGSQTVLRGLSPESRRITTSTFHPHSRSKLLLGMGKCLTVYDTTRPSGPLKTIPMNDASTGDIISVACSPFSKTLVAVATGTGSVGLVDLDKEKGLFRTLNLKVRLTSIAFSPSGESIYLGTDGKLLILDLRVLDKPPKAVVMGSGSRVQTIAAQKKNKAATEPDTKPPLTNQVAAVVGSTARTTSTSVTPAANANKPLVELGARRVSATVPAAANPTKPATVKVKPSPSKPQINAKISPARRPSAAATASPRVTSAMKPKILSPVRDPRSNSTTEVLSNIKGGGRRDPTVTPGEAVKSARTTTRSLISARDRESAPQLPAASRTRKMSATESASARPRVVASSVRMGAESLSAKSGRLRSESSASRPSSSASQRAVPSVQSLPADVEAPVTLPQSRTPSPELPSVTAYPGTPLPKSRKTVELTTPDAKRWMEDDENRLKGKGKAKTVVFRESNDENLPEDEIKERERSLSMQISPMRPSSAGLGHSASWAPSPLRNALPSSPLGGSSTAHDLLRTIVRDTLVDFQQEQRSEMIGLHLDLLRMGRGWKKELRELMDEYVGDLRELREENKRLREDNEMLRRGY
ncbi:WD40 repeat-like protein [Favolaschia claudopus]|uniref:WD40 repeat-like protein n=1 Tax=Favolaschia claudopus TaxID=2862362 RepID=A0AAW0ANZ6_9AGAR